MALPDNGSQETWMCARAEDPGNATENFSTFQPPLEDRRSFLGALLALGSVFVGALLSVPLIRFALFPLLRRTTDLKSSLVGPRSEEHTSELQSHSDLVCRLLLEKKNT